MEQITSTKNEYIKLLRSLKQKKGREETGLFLAESDKCAAEALSNAKVQALLTTQEQHPLAIQAEQKGVRAVLVSQAVIEAVSDVKTPQSAIAVVQKQQGRLPEQGLFVALEDVADPQNVGTILRTADAVGAAGVLLSGKCADYTSPKAVRAAMGSVFHLPVEVAEDFQGRLSAMKKAGVRLLGGHLQGVQAMPGQRENLCVIIGNEARGMSPDAAQLCDYLVKIPIYGKAESLNAAVAAGILLYRCKEGR